MAKPLPHVVPVSRQGLNGQMVVDYYVFEPEKAPPTLEEAFQIVTGRPSIREDEDDE